MYWRRRSGREKGVGPIGNLYAHFVKCVIAAGGECAGGVATQVRSGICLKHFQFTRPFGSSMMLNYKGVRTLPKSLDHDLSAEI